MKIKNPFSCCFKSNNSNERNNTLPQLQITRRSSSMQAEEQQPQTSTGIVGVDVGLQRNYASSSSSNGSLGNFMIPAHNTLGDAGVETARQHTLNIIENALERAYRNPSSTSLGSEFNNSSTTFEPSLASFNSQQPETPTRQRPRLTSVSSPPNL